jgi:hypothetical protein
VLWRKTKTNNKTLARAPSQTDLGRSKTIHNDISIETGIGFVFEAAIVCFVTVTRYKNDA